MGLFDSIKRAASASKEQAKSQVDRFKAEADSSDFERVTRTFLKDFPRASLMAKNGLANVYRQRISKEAQEDRDSLYYTFEQVYRDARRDSMSLSVSQWIGKELYERGDRRVTTKTTSDGERTIYCPE